MSRTIARARHGGRRCVRLLAHTIAFALVAGCAPVPQRPSGDPMQSAFVLVGESGAAIARVITTAPRCPDLLIDGSTRPMRVRAEPATEPLRPTISQPLLSKPSAFPVLTCELRLPADARTAQVAGRALPLPRALPRRIVLFGDSGCRILVSAKVFQACNDASAWPFAQVAAAAAALRPDLVVHLGDYHYRENPCPIIDPGCSRSPWGYGWDAWDADFFTPAASLLAVAPWIVVRGNHESCDRAGQGWWRFLDPRPLVAGRDCNAPADDETGDYSDPYIVPLGDGWSWIVFDSSNVGIAPLRPDDPLFRTYRAEFDLGLAMSAGSRALFLSHHPLLGFAPNPRQTPTGLYPGNGSLQSVLRPRFGDALFPDNVQALFSGHIHLFEAVNFVTPQPPQWIAGTGGDWADVALPDPLPSGATPSAGAVVERLVSSIRPGFTLLERRDDGSWRIEARDLGGAVLAACTLRERKLVCDR